MWPAVQGDRRLHARGLRQGLRPIDNDAVVKITGASDKVDELIKRFKNERNPRVAVTVDLLTTRIDVPEIVNLVFLRRLATHRVEHYSQDELAATLRTISRRGCVYEREELARSLLDHLGFRRMAATAMQAIESALDAAIDNGTF